MEQNTALTPEMIKFNERLQRVEDAIALKEPDKVPIAPFLRLLYSDYMIQVTKISIIILNKPVMPS